VAESAEVGPPGIAAWLVVVSLPRGAVAGPLELSVLPEIFVGPFWTAVVIALGVSSLGHPKYFASPNVCFFPVAPVSLDLFVGYSLMVPLLPFPAMLPVVIPPA
jgi:hypothetical protein